MRLCCIVLAAMLGMLPSIAQKRVQYSVRSGDTYAKIAQKYGIEESALRQANKDCPSNLFPGLILEIPAKPKQVPEKVQESSAKAPYDRVMLQDSCFIDCSILGIRKGMIRFKQDGIESPLQLSVREVSEIRYASGAVKRFGRAARKGGRR